MPRRLTGDSQKLIRRTLRDARRVVTMASVPVGAGDGAAARPGARPVIDVVIPVHNEETDLEPCLRRLHAHLVAELPYPFRITVAENASSDGTVAVARRVAAEL